MVLVSVKGYEINTLTIRDSFSRRAQQYKNRIIEALSILGLTEDDVELHLEPVAIKRMPASVSWYIEGFHLHFIYKGCEKYVENLYVVMKVIELEVTAVAKGEKDIEQFIRDFNETHEVEKERQEARELLGVPADCLDFDLISRNYKNMAKDLHPDMEGGDVEKFKAINRAHKILKRELE